VGDLRVIHAGQREKRCSGVPIEGFWDSVTRDVHRSSVLLTSAQQIEAKKEGRKGLNMKLDGKMLMILAALWYFGKKAGGGVWSDEDMRQFGDQVKALGADPEDVLAVYTSESLLKPSASSGIAWGLAQFTLPTLRKLGWTGTGSEFGQLSVAQQIPYVIGLLKMQIKAFGSVPQTALDWYVLNFVPSKARAKTSILYDSKVKKESAAYKANKGLDTKGRGYISRDDLNFRLTQAKGTKVYLAAVDQLRKLAAQQTD
jgi:hypothetical protein